MKYELSEQDLIDKLEEIASDDRNRAAQIAAIKQLQALRSGEVAEESGTREFTDLYAVGSPRIRTKAA